MRKLFFYFALLTIFVTSSWGACKTGSWKVGTGYSPKWTYNAEGKCPVDDKF